MKSKIIILLLILTLVGAGSWYWYFGGIKPITCGGILVLGCPVGYECKSSNNYPDAGGVCVRSKATPTPLSAQTYQNNKYGFSIPLPDSWKGYTVLNSQWQGYKLEGNPDSGYNEIPSERGTLISIRHPLWTEKNPREDMPIMIFTPAQWVLIQGGKMSVGAAPILPSVLGQNSKYVIALPARYNYDYAIGWEEVDQLVHTLKAFEPTK